MKILATYIVSTEASGTRLSDYLEKVLVHIPSRKGIKKAIQRKTILVNKKTSNTGYRIKEGDAIDWIESQTPMPKMFELQLQIVFEDEYLAMINKPAGLPVSGNQFRTIKNALPFNLIPSKAIDVLRCPLPVHRLDGPTSGLLLVAKTSRACIHLSQQFQDRKVTKKYKAIVMGKLPEIEKIDLKLDDKETITYLEVLKEYRSLKNDYLSLVNLFPKTGRTHQLRRHLAAIGCPVLGDQLYGKEGEILKHKGLFLCATQLIFEHPATGETLNFELELPPKYMKRLENEARRWRNKMTK